MMKDMEVSMLLDFYAGLLTDTQARLLRLYYEEDLSLAEIAQGEGITRQAAQDGIRRGTRKLKDLEARLELSARYRAVQEALALLAEMDDDRARQAEASLRRAWEE